MFGDYKDYDLIEEKSIDVRLKGPLVPLAIKCQGQACYCEDSIRYESVAVAIVGGLQWSVKTEFSLETKFTTCTKTYEQGVPFNQHVDHAKNKGCPHDHVFNGKKLSCVLNGLIKFAAPDPDVSKCMVVDLLVLNKNAQLGHHIMKEIRVNVDDKMKGVEFLSIPLTGMITYVSVIIRILRHRPEERVLTSFECNKILLVNERKFPVNTTWLSICSPVFAAMFQVDMKERDAIDIEICDVISANYFEDFLAMISPDRHLLINPQNVMAVAELADRFQVSWLVSICEREMVKWVEIPLIDRLLFADLHGLEELKKQVLNEFVLMEPYNAKKFYQENQAAFHGRNDLKIELFERFFLGT